MVDSVVVISRLVGRKILCRKCERDHKKDENGNVLLYMPDSVVDPAFGMDWFRIELVSDECETFSVDNIGDFIHCPPYAHGMHKLQDDYFIFDEALVGDGGTNTVIKPFVVERN